LPDDLRAGNPDTADGTVAARQLIERGERHGGVGRRTGSELDDAGAEPDALGVSRDVSQRRYRVGTVGLGRPDGVVAQPLGQLNLLQWDVQVRARIP
jgi:hypothetical protein